METIDEEEFLLEENINKCRCCLRSIIDEQKFITITKVIEQKFFDLTQIKVSLRYCMKNIVLKYVDFSSSKRLSSQTRFASSAQTT
jgi:heme oxygenase